MPKAYGLPPPAPPRWRVHRATDGAHHPEPSGAVVWLEAYDVAPRTEHAGTCRCAGCEVRWTVRPTLAPCEDCGACDCDPCSCYDPDGCNCHDECGGIAEAFVCLDGGEVLCADCARLNGIAIVPCDCALR